MSTASLTSTSTIAPFPTNNSGNPLTSGVGPAVYYGSIAVALTLIIVITIGSRIIYKRRQRVFERTRDREERLALERRGEAAGLPTYYESRINNQGLPHYTVTCEPLPNVTSPPPPTNGPPGAPTAPALQSPTQENHFHFHFPALPAALHLRPRRGDEGSSTSTGAHAYPPNYSTEPPKYEHSYLDSSPDETAQHAQTAEDEAVREAVYAEPFIHPEELRRRRREAGLDEDEPISPQAVTEVQQELPDPIVQRPESPAFAAEQVQAEEKKHRPPDRE